jgi:hypothetical protein
MKIIVGKEENIFDKLKKFKNIKEILDYLKNNYTQVDYDLTTDGYIHYMFKIRPNLFITVLLNFISAGFLRHHYVYLEDEKQIIDRFRIIEDNVPNDDSIYLTENKPKLKEFKFLMKQI